MHGQTLISQQPLTNFKTALLQSEALELLISLLSAVDQLEEIHTGPGRAPLGRSKRVKLRKNRQDQNLIRQFTSFTEITCAHVRANSCLLAVALCFLYHLRTVFA